MDELLDFITARLGEAEAIARAASPGSWMANAEEDEVLAFDGEHVADGFALSGPQLRATVAHIARHDPYAVLRDVEATRRLLADLEAEHHHVSPDCWFTCPQATEEREGETTCNDNELGGPCNCGRDLRVLRRRAMLAARWSTHPAYRPEWKVED